MTYAGARRLLPLAVAALIPLAATNVAAQSSAPEFRVGMVMPLTGPLAQLGKYQAQGIQASLDMVNASGGIAGMQARLISCDSQSVEQQAVICTRRLVGEDKVSALIGAAATPQTLAIIPYIESVGVPLIAMSAGSQTYRPLKKWVFKGLYSTDDLIPAMIDVFKRKSFSKIGAILDTGPFGVDVLAAVKANMDSTMKIVAEERYAPTDTDMSAQVTRLRAANPDVIVNFAPSAQAGATIAKKLQQLGITVPAFLGANLQNEGFANLAGDAVANLVIMTSKVAFEELPTSDPLYPAISEFRKFFVARYPGEKLTTLSGTADGMLLLQAAGKAIGKDALDPEKLRAQLEKTTNFNGVEGQWTFTPESHESSLRAGVAASQYVGGKFVLY